MNYIKAFFGLQEKPTYTLVKSCENGIEERIYPEQKWAVCEIVSERNTMDKMEDTMFFTLFGYISGKNDKNAKIAMTVPVSVRAEPIEDNKEKYSMAFYVPKEYQENTPEPTDSRVKIISRDLHVYTISYGGWSKEADFERNYDKLLAFLKEKNVKVSVAHDSKEPIRYFVGYDAPFKLFNRKNEAWIQACFGIHEKPSYTLLKSCENTIEERIYSDRKWAICELISGRNTLNQINDTMFLILFEYIGGKNDKNVKIAMTAPVSVKAEPIEGNREKYTMAFYLPQKLQENTPTPTDSRVKIVSTQHLHVYTISCGSWCKEVDFIMKYEKLLAFLTEKNFKLALAQDGKEPIRYFVAYDAPFKLFNRKNEVWIQVE